MWSGGFLAAYVGVLVTLVCEVMMVGGLKTAEPIACGRGKTKQVSVRACVRVCVCVCVCVLARFLS